ncbi:hypothetical protein AB0L70_40200 [Kribbella sp. NPDC051952]|uniref:hypothetical protein n=1 Tax=Kribbella sp. NPDC051952 TaxID=3154851 RepID=UPI00343DD098
MNAWTKYGGLLAAGVLTTGLLAAAPASAQQNTTTAACKISAGAVTAGGDHRIQTFAATAPITRTENRTIAAGLWPDGQAKLSSSWLKGKPAEAPGIQHEGLTVVGDTMWSGGYLIDGQIQRFPERVGSQWGAFRAVERSQVLTSSTSVRENVYGITADGTLRRWNLSPADEVGPQIWRTSGSAGGYSGIKSMALISQTKTYDTFLMNGRDGALLMVHIPTASPMKPVVKKLKAATWQGFEAMMAAPCGTGVLLLGIDKDTGAGYLYAVGHGATVIQGLGKVPGTFTDPVNFAWHEYSDPKLLAE